MKDTQAICVKKNCRTAKFLKHTENATCVRYYSVSIACILCLHMVCFKDCSGAAFSSAF